MHIQLIPIAECYFNTKKCIFMLSYVWLGVVDDDPGAAKERDPLLPDLH